MAFCLAACSGRAQTLSDPAPTEAASQAEDPLPAAPDVLNEELTAQLREFFADNYEEAEWYGYVDRLEVFDSEENGRYIAVTFDLEEGATAKRHIRTVVNSLYASFVVDRSRDSGIGKVIGKDASGMVWYTRDSMQAV